MPLHENDLDELLKELKSDNEGTAESGESISVEDTVEMTEEEIEKLLSEGQDFLENDSANNTGNSNEDLMDLLGQAEDENLQEIHELLEKSDNNEAVDEDIVSLLQDAPDEDVRLLNQILEDESETLESGEGVNNQKALKADERKRQQEERKAEKLALKESKKAAKQEAKAAKLAEKQEKKKKNTVQEADDVQQNETKPVKKKAFSRFFDYITEDEEDEEGKKDNENIHLSDENKTILEEMDKDKKKEKKKDRKAKKVTANTSEEDNAEAEGEEKKTKSKKKTKKEKLPEQLLNEETAVGSKDNKLSFKKILPIAMVCLSIGIVIILISHISGDYSAKKVGREAYYSGDYQTCYQNLYGKERNESEQIMYSKSESILRIHLWLREYEVLAEEGAEAEALDSLIQSVKEYPSLYEYASQWNAASEVSEVYEQILNILSEKYHLTEAQAFEIAAAKRDDDYSVMVYAIVDGEGFGSWIPKEDDGEKLPDELPEEGELGDVSFVDNASQE